MVAGDEAGAMGLVTELSPPGRHLERALEIAEALAAFPQDTMLTDRQAALEALGLPLEQGLALEAALGSRPRTAVEGAQRFAGGEGAPAQGTGI